MLKKEMFNIVQTCSNLLLPLTVSYFGALCSQIQVTCVRPFVKKGVFTISWTGGAQNFDLMNWQILPKQCGGQHCVDILLIIHNQCCVPIGNLTLLLNSVASSRLGTVTIIQPGFVICSLRIFQVLKNKVNGFLWMKIIN